VLTLHGYFDESGTHAASSGAAATFADIFRLIVASNHIGQNQLISRLCFCLLNYPGGKFQNGMCRQA
jgi:hypothetical protein